jgi:hypothetical protein
MPASVHRAASSRSMAGVSAEVSVVGAADAASISGVRCGPAGRGDDPACGCVPASGLRETVPSTIPITAIATAGSQRPRLVEDVMAGLRAP